MTKVKGLESAALIEATEQAQGSGLAELGAYPESELQEPLDLILSDLDQHAALTPAGSDSTTQYLVRLLMVRRQLEGYRRAHPDLATASVEQPLFVIGAPRTGTTAVHRLLAMVPTLRAPEGWELLYPLPPPQPDSAGRDARVAWAGAELTAPQDRAAALRSIHLYSARMPKECLSAMALSLRSEEFISRYELPNYRAWLHETDMAPAYSIHRDVLRVLQRDMPPATWALKSPVHLQNLPTLVATYPDARFVITHRDPFPMLSSVSSLVAAMRAAFSATVDPVALGRYHFDLYSRSLSELLEHLDSGLLPAERVIHLQHRQIVTDAAGSVAAACEHLGVELDADARDSLTERSAEVREDGAGAHSHDPAEFGLSAGEVAEAFASYTARFVEEPR